MTLDILIAQYKEKEQTIKPMLDSIALQQGVDFQNINVIIANDGSDIILSDNFLSSYNFPIKYYIKEHSGLSATRNYLLDNSNGEYMMFCDVDDMFLRNDALNTIFNTIKETKCDLLYSVFMVERKLENGDFFYHPFKECHVHGKVICRQFLLNHNIRWKDELVMHDSRYFFTLCEAYAEPGKAVQINTPFYLWKWNEKSITRSKENWLLETYGYFTYSAFCITEELLLRGKTKQAIKAATSFTYLTYFLNNTKNWLDKKNEEYTNNALKNFATYYKKYSSLISLNNSQELQQTIAKLRNNVVSKQTDLFIETITFTDWLDKIQNIYSEEELNEITIFNTSI